MVVATRCTSIFHGFGWEFRLEEDVLICFSAQLAWSLVVRSLSTLIVHRRLLSNGRQGVTLSVHMDRPDLVSFGIAQWLGARRSVVHPQQYMRDPLSHASAYK